MDISFIAAVPHATTEDDIYEGLFIPKGVRLLACYLDTDRPISLQVPL